MSNELDLTQLREQLTIDEGKVNEIYHDHLGLPTVGIGHLVLDSDPESGQPMGTPITEERCIELFESDVESVVADCRILYPDHWDDFPQEAKQVVANMMFNMGRTRLSKFKNHNSAMCAHIFDGAAKEGRDSRWYDQVTNRAERLMLRLEALSESLTDHGTGPDVSDSIEPERDQIK